MSDIEKINARLDEWDTAKGTDFTPTTRLELCIAALRIALEVLNAPYYTQTDGDRAQAGLHAIAAALEVKP